MSNFEISVAEYVRESTNMDITVKDKWPSSGMCCEIEGCETPHFHSFNTYMKHWRKFHCKEINVFECPVPSCSRLFNLKWRVKPHLKSEYHVTNDAGLYGKNSCRRMHNMFYKDPGNITPRKFVKVNISARDDAALARRRYAENNKVDFPHLQEGRDNQVCSGTYLDFDFNNNTSKVVTRW
jgi:hypothetical protein